jgi:hypothetical protein
VGPEYLNHPEFRLNMAIFLVRAGFAAGTCVSNDHGCLPISLIPVDGYHLKPTISRDCLPSITCITLPITLRLPLSGLILHAFCHSGVDFE